MVKIEEELQEKLRIDDFGRGAEDGWETASEGEDESSSREAAGDDDDRQAGAADDHFEDALNEEQQRQRIFAQANAAKAAGNAEYAAGNFRDAIVSYSSALELLNESNDPSGVRAMCYCNRAICYLQLGEFEDAVHESSKALELNPTYVKAYLRRAQAHEKVDHLEESLADLKKVLELEPGNKDAQRAVKRLEPLVEERREKIKAEAIAKAKEVGNKFLGMFGMSVDNFKAVKDPDTGSYSFSYQP